MAALTLIVQIIFNVNGYANTRVRAFRRICGNILWTINKFLRVGSSQNVGDLSRRRTTLFSECVWLIRHYNWIGLFESDAVAHFSIIPAISTTNRRHWTKKRAPPNCLCICVYVRVWRVRLHSDVPRHPTSVCACASHFDFMCIREWVDVEVRYAIIMRRLQLVHAQRSHTTAHHHHLSDNFSSLYIFSRRNDLGSFTRLTQATLEQHMHSHGTCR